MVPTTSKEKGKSMNTAQKSSRKLLTVPDAANRLTRSIPSLRRDIRQRQIDFVRVGGSIRIPIEAIEGIISRGWAEAK